jgi:hypothetical protein
MEGLKEVSPVVNLGIAVFLAFLMIDKISFWVLKLKEKNGNGKGRKDDTQRLPCIQNPLFSGPWDTLKQEAHDTKVIADRLDRNMGKLLKESLLQTHEMKTQTTEIKKQTDVLEGIRRNGDKN